LLTPYDESIFRMDHPKNMALLDFRGGARCLADEAKF